MFETKTYAYYKIGECIEINLYVYEQTTVILVNHSFFRLVP